MTTPNEILENQIKRYSFTDGAHIAPILIDGKYFWIVTEFDGDTYCNGDIICPDTEADNIMKLVYREGMDYGEENE